MNIGGVIAKVQKSNLDIHASYIVPCEREGPCKWLSMS